MRMALRRELAVCFLALNSLTSAFPLLHFEGIVQRQAPQSYSVIPVDGGQSTMPVQTVTDLVVQTQYTTILSTIVITQSDTPTTIIVTSTAAVTITQAVSAPAETKTVIIEPSVTSSPYDDGMWKTTYYSRWTITPSVVLPPSTVQTSSSPTTVSTSTKRPRPDASSSSSSFVEKSSKPPVNFAVAATTLAPSPASTSTSSRSTSMAQTTNWVTAYGQWHDEPNENGSWWW